MASLHDFAPRLARARDERWLELEMGHGNGMPGADAEVRRSRHRLGVCPTCGGPMDFYGVTLRRPALAESVCGGRDNLNPTEVMGAVGFCRELKHSTARWFSEGPVPMASMPVLPRYRGTVGA